MPIKKYISGDNYKSLNKIFIRKETYSNEFRCPIVPKDIKNLISYGFIVYIESSDTRCYKDEEYEENGAIIVNNNWVGYTDFLILGIKELQNIELINNNYHIYFSHSYKNQINSDYILDLFKKSNSILFDLEYFIENNKRIIAFGYYAGTVGCGLGLLQYFLKLENKKLNNLKYWNSVYELFSDVNKLINKNSYKPKICLIGPKGRCGLGVIFFLDLFCLKYVSLSSNDKKDNLEEYDIIFNCINLKENIGTWFDNNTKFNKNLVISDISCDYNNPNNPIKIYNNKTTWSNPIYSYNEFVDIIAIDNLPSLLPFDSSIEFSSKMVKLLETFKDDEFNYWKNNYEIYKDKINNI